MFVSVKCYNTEFNNQKDIDVYLKFFELDGNKPEMLQYDVDLNVNNIVSLEESKITFSDSAQIFKTQYSFRVVIATMINNKKFYIKADSIPELKLKSAIYGNGIFE